MTALGSNRLLAALTPSARASVLNHATSVELPLHTELYAAGVTPRFAYFLLSGLASVVVSMPEAISVEVAMSGADCVIGGLQLLGPAAIPAHCMMQLPGAGLRIPYTRLQSEFASSAELRTLVLASVQEQAAAGSQIAACNRVHSAEQRLVRWLLTAADRTGFDVLSFTHEYLAALLATHRPTVSIAAAELQHNGLIQYSRGSIHIMNRTGLEAAACNCYAIVRDLNSRLYESHHLSPSTN